jgi:uncharacterized membrane protein SpoIIM required for sporulation/uncharacterized RDD family membrane protein YckC
VSTLDVATPERVSVELPVAGIGSRGIAWVIDAALLSGVAIAAYFAFTLVADPLKAVLDLSQFARIAGGLIGFAVLWLYWTVFEVVWEGQTIGKRLVGVRVVRLDGSPVTLVDSAVRNLLRVVDFLPVCYPVGLITMLVDVHHRRLGDLVAGTVLVRDERVDLTKYAKAQITAGARALSAEEVELITGFLTRLDALDPAVRLRLGQQILSRLGIDGEGLDAAALIARLERAAGAETSSTLSSFVLARQADWSRLEALLLELRRHALRAAEIYELDHLYRRASGDLARAGTSFPGTDVHRFLNQLCGRAYAAIYRAPSEPLRSLRRFYQAGFPQAVQATLPYTLAAVALMALGLVLGALTVALEPSGYTWLVDPSLRDFIDRRELWTDSALTRTAPGELATQIFTNNLSVTFKAFALGVTGGVGTVLILVFNGLQLGALLAACAQHGLGSNIFTFISAHGPVELSIICLSGGAGLVLGHALIAPGERARGPWLKERARLAVQLVLGCAPFLVLVGIVEGFVSPGSFFPWPLKALLGAGSFLGFWRYLLRG